MRQWELNPNNIINLRRAIKNSCFFQLNRDTATLPSI